MKQLITISSYRNTIKHFCFNEKTNNETSFFAVYEYITNERPQEIKPSKKGTYKTKDFKEGGKYNFYFFDKTENTRVQLFVELHRISQKEFIFILYANNFFEERRVKKTRIAQPENNRFVVRHWGDNTIVNLINNNGIKETAHIEKFDTSLIKVGETIEFEIEYQLSKQIKLYFSEKKESTGNGFFHYNSITSRKSYSDIVYKVTYRYIVEEITNDTIELKLIDDSI